VGFGSKVQPFEPTFGDAENREKTSYSAPGRHLTIYGRQGKHKDKPSGQGLHRLERQLVARSRSAKGARVGAGSTITEDVPDGALGIARARQVNKPDARSTSPAKSPSRNRSRTAFGGIRLYRTCRFFHTRTGAARYLRIWGSPAGARVGRFPDGEIHVQIDENVRGSDCYVIQPTCRPVKEHVIELSS